MPARFQTYLYIVIFIDMTFREEYMLYANKTHHVPVNAKENDSLVSSYGLCHHILIKQSPGVCDLYANLRGRNSCWKSLHDEIIDVISHTFI
jgi:hypothetical protein